jgi:NAD(P)H-hydrate epimerase
MSTIDKNADCISEIPDLSPFTAIAFGPGCGQNKATAAALKLLIQESRVPLLIDADGLNILAANKTWLAFLPENTILTPHPGEFNRLFGESKNDFERLQKAIESAVKYKCVIVLKGAFTGIFSPTGQVFFNCSGNPGMAKGGSGDVLTGLIAGLLARRLSSMNAALTGVFLHGLAGDIAAEALTQEFMSAKDLIDNLGNAWKSVLYRFE